MLIYAPINFSYDKARIRSELESIPEDKLIYSIFPWKTKEFNPDIHGGWYLGPRELNENISHWYFENGEKHIVQGSTKVTNTINATEPPVNDPTSQGTFKIENGKIVKLHMVYQQPWRWRSDLNIPYIIETAARLPFEYIQLVRLIYTEPGAFCPVHLDESPYDDYYAKGFGKINLNIADGKQTLQIKVNDKIHHADSDVFFFNSSFPHGVAPVSEKRLQIQVSGKLLSDWHLR